MEVLTHTKRSLFRACRRAYFYRHEVGLVPRIVKESRRRGTAFGLALHGIAETRAAPEDTVAAVLEDYYGQASPDSQEDADALAIEQGAVEILALRYVYHYGLDGRREIEYERPLVNPLTGRASRSFVLGGKIDGMEVIGPARARLIEDKLTAQIQPAKIQALPLDEQTTEYLDALLWRGWSGEIEYRYTRWPSIRRKKDETKGGFIDRFAQDVAARPEFYFVQQRLLFPTEQLEEHRLERWQIAKEILRARRTGHWYKSPQTCDPYSGGCRYFALCSCQPDAMSLYKTEEDNPELSAYKEVADGATA